MNCQLFLCRRLINNNLYISFCTEWCKLFEETFHTYDKNGKRIIKPIPDKWPDIPMDKTPVPELWDMALYRVELEERKRIKKENYENYKRENK